MQLNKRTAGKSKTLIGLKGSMTLLVLSLCALAQSTARPNVIMVLADDLGWHELGCYGNSFNETPQLDRLASEGVCFTNAYSTAPVCSPARSSIMTGQLPVQTGITDYMDDYFAEFLDPNRFTSIARTLKNAGYRTGIVGKWHLDGNLESDRGTPAANGFDEVILTQTKRVGGGDYRYPYGHIPGVTQRIFPEENLVDRMNLEATDFITRNKDVPFFLYLSHYAVHTTLDAPDSMVALFNAKRATPGTNTSKTQNPFLGAMLKQVDDGVGQIMAKLRELGLDSNTVLIFTSDNGGENTVTDNGYLRDGKSTLYEGGLRIPFIAHWPGMFASGAVCRTPINLADFYPTTVALTGAALPQNQPMAGVDITPLLKQTGEIASREMLWHYPRVVPHFLGGKSSGALLQGHFKLIRFYDTDKLELYRLTSDTLEAHDLAVDSVALARAMAARLRAGVCGHLTDFTFEDDFNDNQPADWKPFGGTWSAAGGKYTTTAGDGFKAMTHRKYFADFIYQVRVAVPGGVGNAGLVCRANNSAIGTDAYRGYYAGINAQADVVTFGKADNGAWTLLGKKDLPIDTNTAYLLRIKARGARFEIYVNDTANPLITVTDSSFDGGLLGLRSHKLAATYDDVFTMGLAPDSGAVAVRGTDLSHKKATPGLTRTLVAGQGSRLVKIAFSTADRAQGARLVLFDIRGKAVRDPFMVAVAGNSVHLRFTSTVRSGWYTLRILHQGRAESIRLLVL